MLGLALCVRNCDYIRCKYMHKHTREDRWRIVMKGGRGDSSGPDAWQPDVADAVPNFDLENKSTGEGF